MGWDGDTERAKRSGWWIAGVKDPETVAEHSFGVGLIGSVLAMMEGVAPAVPRKISPFRHAGYGEFRGPPQDDLGQPRKLSRT